MLAATIERLGQDGLSGLTVERVAKASGVGRATIYRRVAKGRDELITSAITWELGRFVDRLRAVDVGDGGGGGKKGADKDLFERLELLVVGAVEALEGHEVFQSLVADDPIEFLSEIGGASTLVLDLLSTEFAGELERMGVSHREVDWAMGGEYLARMVMSYVGSSGRVSLHDRAGVASLVRHEFLGWTEA